MLENIKINPEFERLIPPLVDDEFELLKKTFLQNKKYIHQFLFGTDLSLTGTIDSKYFLKTAILNSELSRKNLITNMKLYRGYVTISLAGETLLLKIKNISLVKGTKLRKKLTVLLMVLGEINIKIW